MTYLQIAQKWKENPNKYYSLSNAVYRGVGFHCMMSMEDMFQPINAADFKKYKKHPFQILAEWDQYDVDFCQNVLLFLAAMDDEL